MLSKHKAKLQANYLVATPEWDTLKILIHKPCTYALAARCGVPHPKTFSPKTLAELHQLRDELAYPCLVKPVIGHLFFSRFRSKNFRVNGFDELLRRHAQCTAEGHEVMIQEIIPGPDSEIYQCLVYVDLCGAVTVRFITCKLRQNPPHFGVARVAVSHRPLPELEAMTGSMLREIAFRGIAHAEFKRDLRDGVFKLIEINGRLPRSNWLSAYCGVNFPWIAYEDLARNTRANVSDYEEGVHWIELLEDLANSVARHRSEGLRYADYLLPYLAKKKTFADFSCA